MSITPPIPNRLLRLPDIIAPNGPIPVSKSTWWNKVRTGEFPSPVRVSQRVTAWKESDILDLLAKFESQAND